MRTIVGHYASADEAQHALDDLGQAGFTKDEISYIAHDGSGRFADLIHKKALPGSGTAKGTVSGLFLGLAAIAIPGIGPAVAAGPIALALAGAATGGLLGALTDTGLPEAEAKHWAERVARGGSLVLVRTEGEKVERAHAILSGTAGEVRLHEENRDPAGRQEFPNFGSEGGSSQWSQRVLRVQDDDVVVAERTISRDSGAKQFDRGEE